MKLFSKRLIKSNVHFTKPILSRAFNFSSSTTITVPEISVDYLIIGGGVVGLSIAERLSRRKGKSTLLVEKNSRLGEETSSRNSEIIHAGIYYPNDFLKTKLCIRGKDLLYSLLTSVSSIPFLRVGKWIVAQDNETEISYLRNLYNKSKELQVEVYFLSQKEIKLKEPYIHAKEVLDSPTTGIFDSHSLMNYLECKIEDQGGDIALKHKVINIVKSLQGNGYLIQIENDSSSLKIHSKNVINSAGLFSDKIANYLLPSTHHYKLYYVKGHYFCYRGDAKINHLIYPVPPKNLVNMGTHLTLDLSGRIRFGPDALYQDNPSDYSLNDARIDSFADAVKTYMPSIKKENLYPDYTGIRPKLQEPGGPFRDFIIKEEIDHDLEGFVNLVGIESPGLTSSLAIAEMVDEILLDK
ncbi:FAD dependent oxidoreductase [Glomus cerebriforme]|uniref:L-2-hydroxyglutarate dehydrogenase, mitochondrial n=1 Tax=Glomus cerebriforme TaxID=658196 RepID=A0A397T6V3_9GLOM|nr:FAD dependent oxidoreductase [Glomus cerebriforme]